jgi:hypothetical protein
LTRDDDNTLDPVSLISSRSIKYPPFPPVLYQTYSNSELYHGYSTSVLGHSQGWPSLQHMAVAHCQNATGTDATRACWAVVNIFGSNANKKLIHHDLNYASTKPDDWWEFIKLKNSKDFTLENRIPFPFIQTCLLLGTAYDFRLHNPFPFFYPVVPYETGISPTNLLWNNQTGYTIVDITDTDQLRYCFMFPPSPPSSPAISDQSDEPPDEDEPLRCRPLTLEEYLSCPGIVEADIDVDLSRWHLITPDTLRELWPEVPWPDQNDRAPCSQQIPHCDRETTMPSLTDLSFHKIIEEALDNPRMEEEELELTKNMPDFSRHLRQLLYESPESVKRPCGIALLGRALRTEKTLDFSPFP